MKKVLLLTSLISFSTIAGTQRPDFCVNKITLKRSSDSAIGLVRELKRKPFYQLKAISEVTLLPIAKLSEIDQVKKEIGQAIIEDSMMNIQNGCEKLQVSAHDSALIGEGVWDILEDQDALSEQKDIESLEQIFWIRETSSNKVGVINSIYQDDSHFEKRHKFKADTFKAIIFFKNFIMTLEEATGEDLGYIHKIAARYTGLIAEMNDSYQIMKMADGPRELAVADAHSGEVSYLKGYATAISTIVPDTLALITHGSRYKYLELRAKSEYQKMIGEISKILALYRIN